MCLRVSLLEWASHFHFIKHLIFILIIENLSQQYWNGECRCSDYMHFICSPLFYFIFTYHKFSIENPWAQHDCCSTFVNLSGRSGFHSTHYLYVSDVVSANNISMSGQTCKDLDHSTHHTLYPTSQKVLCHTFYKVFQHNIILVGDCKFHTLQREIP